MADTRKDCCKQPENLESRESDDLNVRLMVCRVCGCRHFEVTLEPSFIGLEGAAL